MLIFVICCFLTALSLIYRTDYDNKMKLLFVFMASTGLVFGLITFIYLRYKGLSFFTFESRALFIYAVDGLICLLKGLMVNRRGDINRLLIKLTGLDTLGIIGIVVLLIMFR